MSHHFQTQFPLPLPHGGERTQQEKANTKPTTTLGSDKYLMNVSDSALLPLNKTQIWYKVEVGWDSQSLFLKPKGLLLRMIRNENNGHRGFNTT